MASTAITAQGSTLSIATGTGGAKTITAVAVGNPTILTAAAHGFNEGDVVTLAALTGADAALLNGQTVSVRNKTANTFAVYIDTTGKTITPGAGTATPVTYTLVGNVKDFSGFDGSASELDITNLSSTAKEFLLGLTDPGQFSMNVDYDDGNAGQAAVRAKQVSGLITGFKLILSDSGTITFNAFVKKYSLSGGVDAPVKAAIDLRVSGAITGL